ncbi:MAG: lysylphosphatidylglycerol synthase domain-containing protein [Dehalococcoidia bacterium]
MRRLTVAGILTTGAGVALFVWLIWYVGPGEIWAGFRQIGWGLVLIIFIAGLRFAVRAAAWQRCLEPPHHLRFTDAFAAVLSGDALGNITPLGPIVGEPAKAAFVRARVPIGAALTALAIENVFYTLSVAAMIAAGSIALLVRTDIAPSLRHAGELAIAGVFALYLATLWTIWRRPAVLSSSVAVLGRLTSSSTLDARVAKVRALEERVYTFASRRRHALMPIGALELAFHALGVLEVHVTLWLLLGDAPPLMTSFVLETVNRLITVVFKPVPMQVGVNEAGTALVTQVLGLTLEAGLTLAIVRKARVLFWIVVGSVLLVRHGLTARAVLEDDASHLA